MKDTPKEPNYVCGRCRIDWEGAPGHPRDYCDQMVLRELANAGLAFLESKRADTAVSYQEFKKVMQRYFGRPIA